MRRSRAIHGLLFGLFASASLHAAQPEEFANYVGREVCRQCHDADGPERPCALKHVPKHDEAYLALCRPEAAEIALLSGVAEPPEESRICLGCHATSADDGPRWTRPTFDIRHGVQCEACHDAGSRHADHNLAGDAGSTEQHAEGIRRGDGSVCEECHVDRPSHREVLRGGFCRAAADRRYRTPVNVVVSPGGQRLYVPCEQSNSVAIVDPRAGRVIAEIPVGRRPHDAAVDSQDRTLYVTNRLDGTVSVVDIAAARVRATVPVGSEPHGVLIDPSGRFIYVLNTGEDSISIIDVGALHEIRRLAAGVGPWSLALRNKDNTIWVTNVRPNPARFREPHDSELTCLDCRHNAVKSRPIMSDANMLQGIAAVPGSDVVLFALMRTKNLVPLTRLAQGWAITNGLGVLWPDGHVDQVLLDEPNAAFPDPMDVSVSPDGRYALVTAGGSDEVALVDVPSLLTTLTGASPHERTAILPNHLGMSSRFVLKRVAVGHNPRGVAISPDGAHAYVVNALSDSLSVIRMKDFTIEREIALGGPIEITPLRRGERLFHGARNCFGRQFSCRSCHPDGHTNGLAFDIEADRIGLSPVDNRTLRGILDTPPFKWEGINPSLQRQCGPRLAAFFTRLAPFAPDELDDLVRYISTIERPPNRHRRPDGLTPSQRRGELVFNRNVDNHGNPLLPEQRCVGCHNTPYRTAGTQAAVGTTMWLDAPVDIEVNDLHEAESFGNLGIVYFHDTGSRMKAFDVPHLNNIYDSAPYLHNGSAGTLEEIWTRYNMYESHGRTNDLTRRQFNDLIAYLKSQ